MRTYAGLGTFFLVFCLLGGTATHAGLIAHWPLDDIASTSTRQIREYGRAIGTRSRPTSFFGNNHYTVITARELWQAHVAK